MLVGGAAYAWLAAGTRPFTTGADVVTALPLVALVVVVVVQLLTGRPARMVGARDDRSPAGGAVPWLLLIAAAVAWELAALFGSPRSAHPTVSSIYDSVARWQAAKAAILFGWLALGWYLVRR